MEAKPWTSDSTTAARIPAPSPIQAEPLTKAAVAEAKASYLGACALRLQSAARQRYLPFIEAEFPHLAASYRSTYGRSVQAGDRYRQGLRDHFRALCATHGVVFDRYYKTEEDDQSSAGDSASAHEMPAQLTLSL